MGNEKEIIMVKVTLKKGYSYRTPAAPATPEIPVYGRLYKWEDNEVFDVPQTTLDSHRDIMEAVDVRKAREAREAERVAEDTRRADEDAKRYAEEQEAAEKAAAEAKERQKAAAGETLSGPAPKSGAKGPSFADKEAKAETKESKA
jgi:hypothetical protein